MSMDWSILARFFPHVTFTDFLPFKAVRLALSKYKPSNLSFCGSLPFSPLLRMRMFFERGEFISLRLHFKDDVLRQFFV